MFLLLKRTVVMHIMWSYTWHPTGRCHCHTCSTAFSVKLFDGQRGIFDRTVETLHGCPHHPGPLHCWNCLQHHSQILHHKCHYKLFTEEKFVIGDLRLPLLDFLLCICLIAVWKSALYHCTVHVIVDIILSLWENTVGLLEVASLFQGRSQFEQILSSVSSSHQLQWHPCSPNHEFWW